MELAHTAPNTAGAKAGILLLLARTLVSIAASVTVCFRTTGVVIVRQLAIPADVMHHTANR